MPILMFAVCERAGWSPSPEVHRGDVSVQSATLQWPWKMHAQVRILYSLTGIIILYLDYLKSWIFADLLDLLSCVAFSPPPGSVLARPASATRATLAHTVRTPHHHHHRQDTDNFILQLTVLYNYYIPYPGVYILQLTVLYIISPILVYIYCS